MATIDSKEILNKIKIDLKNADSSKANINKKIQEWSALYNADKLGNEEVGKAQIVIPDVKKASNMQSSLLIAPFISANKLPQTFPKTLADQSSANMNGDILNYQYKNEFDSFSFAREISTILVNEGTCIVKTGWDRKVKTEKILNQTDIPEDMITAILESYQGDTSINVKLTKGSKKGLTNINITKEKVICNKPTAIVCKNENIFVDPSATSFKEARFVIHRFYKSVSDIAKEKNGIYNLVTDEELSRMRANSNGGKQDYDEAGRESRLEQYSYDHTFSTAVDNSKLIKIYEYWGEYDIDGDGINEQIVITWADDFNVILRCEKNPYPDNDKPFAHCVYGLEPFAIWGYSLAEMIGYIQKMHTALARSYQENIASSTNGLLITPKGFFSPLMKQAYEDGSKRVLEANFSDTSGMIQGNYNQIPQSLFNIYEMMNSDLNMLSGISKASVGDISATVGRTASGIASVMSSSERFMNTIIMSVSNMYKDVFTKWYKYNQKFLDNDQMFKISGQLKPVQLSEIQSEYEFNVEVDVNVNSEIETKSQQINMFLQQAHQFGDQLPPDTIKLLVSELFRTMGKYEEAEMIQNYKREPTEYEIMLQQLELAKAEAEVNLINSQVQENLSRADNASAQAVNNLIKSGKTEAEAKRILAELGLFQEQADLETFKKGLELDKMSSEIEKNKQEPKTKGDSNGKNS